MPLATSAKVAAACSLAGLATDTEGANVLDGASAVGWRYGKKGHFKVRNPSKCNFRRLALLSAVAHGSNEATALVTAAAISLCPLLSTEGSLRLSAGARPSVGRLVSTEACCAAAWASCSCCCWTSAASSCWVSMIGMFVGCWLSAVESPSSDNGKTPDMSTLQQHHRNCKSQQKKKITKSATVIEVSKSKVVYKCKYKTFIEEEDLCWEAFNGATHSWRLVELPGGQPGWRVPGLPRWPLHERQLRPRRSRPAPRPTARSPSAWFPGPRSSAQREDSTPALWWLPPEGAIQVIFTQQLQRLDRIWCSLSVFTSACVSIAAAAGAASSAGAASVIGVSSVCMGSSVELSAALTPSVIEEINCRQDTTQGLLQVDKTALETLKTDFHLMQHQLVIPQVRETWE